MSPERFEKLKATLARRQPDLTVLMDDVHKAHNLSAILRTADAVGIMKVHGVSPQRAIQRYHLTSGGSRKWVATQVHQDIEESVQHFQAQGHQVVAAHFSQRAVDFRRLDYTRPTTLLLGNELQGVSERASRLADHHAIIPMLGMTVSLNVSVAAALILYEVQRQRQNAGLYDHCRIDKALYDRMLFEWAYPKVARYCRARGEPYPELDEAGYLKPR